MLDDKLNIGVKTSFLFLFLFSLHYFPETFMIHKTTVNRQYIFLILFYKYLHNYCVIIPELTAIQIPLE